MDGGSVSITVDNRKVTPRDARPAVQIIKHRVIRDYLLMKVARLDGRAIRVRRDPQ